AGRWDKLASHLHDRFLWERLNPVWPSGCGGAPDFAAPNKAQASPISSSSDLKGSWQFGYGAAANPSLTDDP
ncbi:MAG: hypothetical protein ABI977_19420, partial [Acidobacteriota bacterium]